MEDIEVSMSKDGPGDLAQPTYMREFRQYIEFLKKCVIVLVCCVVALFGLVIWLAVMSHDPESHESHASHETDDADIVFSHSPVPPSGYSYGGFLSAGSGEWVTKEEMPIALSDLSSVELEGYTYIVGGLLVGNIPSNQTMKFNPVLEVFDMSLPNAPRARFRHTMAASDHRIFVIGGKDNWENDASTDAVDVLDLTTNQWSTPVVMPSTRSDCASAVFDGKIYVFGGYDEIYNIHADVLQLDTTTFTWTTKTSLPVPRGDLSAVTVGSMIYVLGGWDESFTAPNTLLHAYDPSMDIFTAKASMAQGRGDAAAVTISSGSFLMVGGERESNVEWVNEVPLHNVEEYMIELDTWVSRAPLGDARFRFTGTGGPYGVHVFGGHKTGNVPMNVVDSYYYVDVPNVFYHEK